MLKKFADDSAAEYRLVFEEHEDYFLACVEAGHPSSETIAEFQQKMAHEISVRSYARVIIKRDVPITASTVELCAVIYQVRNWAYLPIRYAFVDVNPEHIPAYRMAIMYAVSRGISVEVFVDIPSAKRWLLA